MHYLIYSSHQSYEMKPRDIESILSACQRNNPSKGITGVLFYTNHYFIQYLEGKETDVKTQFEKIKKDDRHLKVIKLSSGTLEERHFPCFDMAYKNVCANSLEYLISSNDQTGFDSLVNGDKVAKDKALKTLIRFYEKVK